MPLLESIVREHHRLVFHVANGILRDSSAAEDAAQDVFLALLKDPVALDRVESVKAFVCRMAVNRALEIKRSAGRREKRELATHAGRAVMDPVEAAFRAEVRARIAELPEEQRIVADLHGLRGLTRAETAAALDLPQGTVASRFSAAVAALRVALGVARPAGAVAALLAALESGMADCGAEEAVPAGLEQRLMGRLGTSAAAPGRSRRLPAAAVAALSLVAFLLLTFGITLWHSWEAARTAGLPAKPEIASNRPQAPLQPEKPDPAGGNAVAGGAPVAPAGDVLEISGLLHRGGHKGELSLTWSSMTPWPEPAVVDDVAEGGSRTRRMRRWSAAPHFEIPGPLAELPVGGSMSFEKWLNGNGALADVPRAWVRVRVRRLVPGKELAGAALECLEILEREILSTPWLEAWNEMYRINAELKATWDEEPGIAKRSRLLALSGRFAAALRAAEAARAGESPVRWRVAREREIGAACAGLLARTGCGRDMPSFPVAADYAALVLRCESPALCREAVLAQFGPEALAGSALLVVAGKSETGEREVREEQYSVEELCSMSQEKYDGLRAAAAALTPEERKLELLRTAGRDPGPMKGALQAFGIEGAVLDAIDRERLVLESGVLVTAVVPGSRAEAAGVLVGDVIWRLTVRIWEKRGDAEARDVERVLLARNPALMDDLLSTWEESGTRVVEMDLVRTGGVVRVTVGE